MFVVNGKTGDRSQMVSFDFDVRDTVEVMFEGVPPVEGEEEVFTYNFLGQSETEADLEMARDGNRKGGSNPSTKDVEAALGEALRGSELEKTEPTYEDFLVNYDIQFEDLSPTEKLKAAKHSLDDLLDLFESYKHPEEERGFLSKLFS
eukprot:gnl/Spiro4/28121_TR13919_c0_g1_i1.p1 gnl/Spiro4/28121_TR13919_c0_g1~~gnl/Spiro4/28121_TR13919_c0_g1_i1.p1  ORF type:complete len:160 (-),score=17.59 gnl/Spiro4/28121_TR13919_c0_g1_i1:293-736(-)